MRNKNAINLLKPQTGKKELLEIQTYLSSYISPFITLFVENPVYEEILVECNVGFREGYDEGYYTKQLNEDIKRYLSPWAYEEGEDIVFGGKIYKSQILKFVEDQPYVDFVTDFIVTQYLGDFTTIGVGSMEIECDFIVYPEFFEEIQAASSKSILVSAQDHNITAIKFGDYQCQDDTAIGGIGTMIVDVDFYVE